MHRPVFGMVLAGLLTVACSTRNTSSQDIDGFSKDTMWDSNQQDRFESAISDLELHEFSDTAEVLQPPKVLKIELAHDSFIRIHSDPFKIEAFKKGKAVFKSAIPPIEFGVVLQYDSNVYYDPLMPPAEIEWKPALQVVGLVKGQNQIEFCIEVDGSKTLWCSLVWSGSGIASFQCPSLNSNQVMVKLRWTLLDKQENFYGLGESFDSVARKGTTRAMVLSVDFESESGYNEAHFPIPLLVSTFGSGVFIEDRHPGNFDVCATDPELIEATFATTRDFRWHLLIADSPLDVLSLYASLTGYPALPPIWAFGVIQWRNEVTGQDMVIEDAIAMREHDMPCSAIWIDRPWATAHESFIFDPDMFPAPQEMIEELHSLGYRLAVWSAPYLSKELEQEYAEAQHNGYFVKSKEIKFEQFGTLMDFTNPGAVKLWQDLIANAVAIGVEGFKLDYGEDIIPGYQKIKFNFSFYNGETEQTMHHWYHYFYHKTYKDTLPGDVFILSRAGCYGDQTQTSVVWPSDLCSDFYFHHEDGHVGGLPAAIIAGLTVGASGYPFYGSDTGGFRHYRPSKEVLLRWVAYSALSPVLQFGGGGENHNPWDFTKYEEQLDDGTIHVSQFDEETLEIFRKFAKLHIRLFPYIYTYAVMASKTGIPVMRPFGMQMPQVGFHPDFEYFFGDWLIVYPSYAGQESLEVYVPKGRWIDWWDDSAHDGPLEISMDTPLDRVVLLVKEGALIPMLGPEIDTLSPATADGVNSYANLPGYFHIRAYPSLNPTQFTLWSGAKLSMESFESKIVLQMSKMAGLCMGIVWEVHLGPSMFKDAGSMLVTSQHKGGFAKVNSYDHLQECINCYFFGQQDKILFVKSGSSDDTIEVVFQPK